MRDRFNSFGRWDRTFWGAFAEKIGVNRNENRVISVYRLIGIPRDLSLRSTAIQTIYNVCNNIPFSTIRTKSTFNLYKSTSICGLFLILFVRLSTDLWTLLFYSVNGYCRIFYNFKFLLYTYISKTLLNFRYITICNG